MNRDELHARMMAMLKDQDYGFVNAQPSRYGMAWVIVNTVSKDVVRAVLRAKADAWDECEAARAKWMQDQRHYSEDEMPNPYRIAADSKITERP